MSRPTLSYLLVSLTALAAIFVFSAHAGAPRSLFRGAQRPAGFAVDAQGGIHVAWIAGDGVHYTTVIRGKRRDTLVASASAQQPDWPALALDSAGLPHVAFQSGPDANRTVQYAHIVDGGWDYQEAGTGGFGTAIAVGSDDRPRIAHARADGTVELLHQGPTNWLPETVAGIAAATDAGLSLALDSADHAHIGLQDADSQHPVYATNASGAWVVEDLADSRSRGAAIALDSLGLPHFALPLTDAATIRYRRFDGTHWSSEDIYDPNDLGTTNVPAGAALALDPHDRPEIIFATRLGGAPTATVVHVYRDGAEWRGGPLASAGGLDSVAIAFDPNGVAYDQWALAAKGGTGLAKYAVIALPDLSGTWTSLGTVVTNGVATLTGTLQVTNAGPGKSRKASLGLYLSDDGLVDPNDLALVSRAAVGALAPGASRTVKIAVSTGAAVAGKHLIAVVDPQRLLDDLDRTNNEIDGALGD